MYIYIYIMIYNLTPITNHLLSNFSRCIVGIIISIVICVSKFMEIDNY